MSTPTPQTPPSIPNLTFWEWFIEAFDKLILVFLLFGLIGVSVFSALHSSNGLFELSKDLIITILGALIGIIKGRGETNLPTKSAPPANPPSNQ